MLFRSLDQVRERIRYLHYSLRTEQAYVHWVRAYVRFHGLRHPKEMGQAEVEAFVSWLSAVLSMLSGTHGSFAQLPYGKGVRMTEALQLRVKDIDFDSHTVIVRCGSAHVLKLGGGAVRSPLDALALPAAAAA